jgi:hypothetical protein
MQEATSSARPTLHLSGSDSALLCRLRSHTPWTTSHRSVQAGQTARGAPTLMLMRLRKRWLTSSS